MNSPAAVRKEIFIACLIFLFCLSVYFPSLDNGFMYDDFNFTSGKYNQTYQSLADIFTVTRSQHYSPFFYALNLTIFKLFGSHHFYYHSFNFLLFFFHGLLIFKIISLIARNRLIGFFSALFFLLHPVNLEQITYITNNFEPLCGIFLIVSFLNFYTFNEDQSSPKHLWVSLLFYLFALLSWEMAHLLVIYLFSYLYLLQKQPFSRCLKLTAGHLVLSAMHIGLWLLIARPESGLLEKISSIGISWPVYFASLGKLFTWYLGNLIFPDRLVFMLNIAPVSTNTAAWSAGFIFAIALSVWLMFGIFKKNLLTFALVWFLSGLLPFSVIIFSHSYNGLVIEPHWFYFPSIGFFLLLAIGLNFLRAKMNRFLFLFFSIALFAYFIYFIKLYQPRWETAKEYSHYWLSQAPDNAIALMALSNIYINEKNYEKALPVLFQLLDNTEYAPHIVHSNIGFVYFQLERLPLAKKHLNKALQIRPDYAHALNTLGTVHVQKNDFGRAQALFEQSIEIDPHYTLAKLNLIDIYLTIDRPLEAATLLEEVFQTDPHPDAYFILGQILIGQNKTKEAVAVWREALDLTPDDARFEHLIEKYKQ